MSYEEINRNQVEHTITEADAGVYAYDKALVEDLRARFRTSDVSGSTVNDTVQIGSASRMFEILGRMNDDKIVMPFVSLERIDWTLNLDRQGYQTFIGDEVYTRFDSENQLTEIRAQAIPITINWRLSVWSTDRITNDALVRELLFYYHLRPSLMVTVGYGLNMKHKFNIYFNSGVEDNSDLANQGTNGVYFRQDLTLYTDDAYLWHANHQPKVEIVPGVRFSYDDINVTGEYTNIKDE